MSNRGINRHRFRRGVSIARDLTILKYQNAATQRLNGSHIMTNEQDRPTPSRDVFHLGKALLLKCQIAHGKYLIDDQYFGFQVCRHRKCQANMHSTGVVFDRGIQELLDVTEGHNVGKLSPNLCVAHSEDCAVQEDIFPARQFRMESGPHLQ